MGLKLLQTTVFKTAVIPNNHAVNLIDKMIMAPDFRVIASVHAVNF